MHLTGLILAGGKSSRMGFDKINLNFHGERQIDWLHALLKKFCNSIYVSGNSNKISGSFNFIEDQYDSGGPLNGIISAFNSIPTASWLVVPIDMPHVNEDVIEFLIKHRDESKVATCFKSQEGKLEPLPVILEGKAHPSLLHRFSNEKDSLHGFLTESDTMQLMVLDDAWLINKNYPD